MKYSELIKNELVRARKEHSPITSLHEGYAILLEEVDELWTEIKTHDIDKERVLSELIQVSAMAERIATDCLSVQGD